MIPEERFSSESKRARPINPYTRNPALSAHWGPVALNDASQGLLVQIWNARVAGNDVMVSSPNTAEFVALSRANAIAEVSISFDQNGRLYIAFVEEGDGPFLWWFDPDASAMVITALSGDTVNPRITLDDPRQFNLANSDIILGYVRDGLVRYRQQRDRYLVEITPPIGLGGSPASATGLGHVSRTSANDVQFYVDVGGDDDWPLADVMEELSGRVGLTPDKMRLADSMYHDIVRGFMVTNQYPCYGAMQALSQVYFFDPSNADGKVRFVPRGGSAVGTITEGDMLDNDEDIEVDSRRGDPISVPRVLHLNYYDVDGGLATDKQRSERPEGTRSQGEMSLQSAVLMQADQAATVVAKHHALQVELQKGELNFQLGDNWLRLTESDPVFIAFDDGRVVRAQLGKVDTDDGMQTYRAGHDRQSIYTMQVEGIPAAPIPPPPSQVVGAPLIEFIDTQILRDRNDQLGWYMAVSGVFPAWQGARVDLSLDGGATYVDGAQTTVSAIMGSTTTELGDHPIWFPDTHNTVRVSIATPNAGLESVTFTGLLNRLNRAMIGDEMIQFGDADEVEPGVWELSNLIRGRKGTESEVHAIGERFVLLDSAVIFIPADLSMLGRSLTFRATSFGTSTDDATIITVTFTGQSQTERAPTYLQARRDGTDLVASWQGVGRLGSGAHVAQGAYFLGYRVTLTDGSVTQTFDQLAQIITTSLAAFTGPVTVSIQQRNQLTGLGPAIEAII